MQKRTLVGSHVLRLLIEAVPHLLLLLLLAPLAQAKSMVPMYERGLADSGTIISSGKDDVNVLNGNVSVRVPLTPAFPQKGLLALQIEAAYNMNLWTNGRNEPDFPPFIYGNYGFMSFGGDLGPGWIVHPFGRVAGSTKGGKLATPAALAYEDPSGGRHTIAALDEDYPEAPKIWLADEFDLVSLDSGLEVFRAEGDVYPWDAVIMKRPDGVTVTFGHYVHARWSYPKLYRDWEVGEIAAAVKNSSPITGWYPTRVEDPYGNAIVLCYQTALGAAHLLKTITDSTDRVIRFDVTNVPASVGPYNLYVYRSITYPTFEDSAGGTVQFDYKDGAIKHPFDDGTKCGFADFAFRASIGPAYIQCPVTHLPTECGPAYSCIKESDLPSKADCPTDLSYPTPLLTGISVPEGLSYSFTTNDFGEVEEWTDLLEAEYDYDIVSESFERSKTECQYREVDPTSCGYGSNDHSVRAVTARRVTYGSGSGKTDVWGYSRDTAALEYCATASNSSATVTDPLGNDTLYLYYNSPILERAASGQCVPSVGEPRRAMCDDSRLGKTGSWAEGLLCRTITYDGSKDSGLALKVTDNVWEQSDPTLRYGKPDGPRWPRIIETKETYPTDGDRYHRVEYKDYDGYGHFKNEVHSGDIGNDARRLFTRWQASTSNWILNRYDLKQTYDGVAETLVSEVDYAFDSTDGSLDLVTSHCRWSGGGGVTDCDPGGTMKTERALFYDDDGNLEREEWWRRPGSDYEYAIEHEYQYGALSRSFYPDLSLNVSQRTIDSSSGLPTAQTETTGVVTTFDYDHLGRVTESRRGTEDKVTVTYPSGREWIAAQGSGVARREYHVFADQLGRTTEERTLNAAGTEVKRKTDYDQLGRVMRRYDWGKLVGSAAGHTYFEYDALGRESRRVRDVGSPKLDVNTTYEGVRKQTTKVLGGKSGRADYVRYFDAFGNLTRVEEPTVGGGVPVTDYGYDGLDNLSLVHQNWGGEAERTRSFEYDSLGNLRRSVEPESGEVRVKSVDAKGRPTVTVDANGAEIRRYYDFAERLLQVKVAGAEVSGFTYGTGASGAPGCDGRSRGQLKARTSSRSGAFPSIVVAEEFCYETAGQGRVTKAVADYQNSLRLQTDYGYDSQGFLRSITYPRIEGGPTRRTIQRTVTHGFDTRVEEPGGRLFVSGVTTNPGGGLQTLLFGNGIFGNFEPDAINRPAALSYRTGSATGAEIFRRQSYGYDGLGNLLTVIWTPAGAPETDRFTYDKLSRLTSGAFHDQSGQLHNGEWNYDGFTNLTKAEQDGANLLSGVAYTDKNRFAASFGYIYDDNGNVTDDGTFAYDHQPGLNRPWQVRSGATPIESYGYDADGQRLVRERGPNSRYFVRDLDGQVLSEFEWTDACQASSQPPAWVKDYVYLGSRVLAQIDNNQTGTTEVQAYGLNGSAKVLWKQVPGATTYSIYRSTDPSAAPAVPAFTGVNCSPTGTPTNFPGLGEFCWRDDPGRSNGTTYYYWVATSYACYEPEPTGPAAATPSLPPPAPTMIGVERNWIEPGPSAVVPKNGGAELNIAPSTSVGYGSVSIDYAIPGIAEAPTIQSFIVGSQRSDIAVSAVARDLGASVLAASHSRWIPDPPDDRCAKTLLYVENRGLAAATVWPTVTELDGNRRLPLEPKTIAPGCGATWTLELGEAWISEIALCGEGTVYLSHDAERAEHIVATLRGIADGEVPLFDLPFEVVGEGVSGTVHTSYLLASGDNLSKVTIRNNAGAAVSVATSVYLDGAPAETIAPTLYVHWQPLAPATGVTGYRVYRRPLGSTGPFVTKVTPAPVAGPWHGDPVGYFNGFEYQVRATLNYFNEGAGSASAGNFLPYIYDGDLNWRYLPRFAFTDRSDTKIRMRNTIDAGINVSITYLDQSGVELATCALTIPPNRSSVASARSCLGAGRALAEGSIRVSFTGTPEALLVDGRFESQDGGFMDIPSTAFWHGAPVWSLTDAPVFELAPGRPEADSIIYLQNLEHATAEVILSACGTPTDGSPPVACEAAPISVPAFGSKAVSLRDTLGSCLAGVTTGAVTLKARLIGLSEPYLSPWSGTHIAAVENIGEEFDANFSPREVDPPETTLTGPSLAPTDGAVEAGPDPRPPTAPAISDPAIRPYQISRSLTFDRPDRSFSPLETLYVLVRHDTLLDAGRVDAEVLLAPILSPHERLLASKEIKTFVVRQTMEWRGPGELVGVVDLDQLPADLRARFGRWAIGISVRIDGKSSLGYQDVIEIRSDGAELIPPPAVPDSPTPDRSASFSLMAEDPVAETGLTLLGAPIQVAGLLAATFGSTMVPGERVTFYHWDHLGTPRVATNELGAVVTRTDYWPYGLEVKRTVTGNPPTNTHQFTGHERDARTGLDYMMARYYSAGAGRFMSVDPGNDVDVMSPYTWNRYAYVRGNPLNFVDPSGTLLKKSSTFQDRLKTDEIFRKAFEAYARTKSGKRKLERMERDRDTVYTLKVGTVKSRAGLSQKTEHAFGATTPSNPQMKESKGGFFNFPEVSMTVDVDYISSSYSDPATRTWYLAETLFHESIHGGDLGFGGMGAMRALDADLLLKQGRHPEMHRFKNELFENMNPGKPLPSPPLGSQAPAPAMAFARAVACRHRPLCVAVLAVGAMYV